MTVLRGASIHRKGGGEESECFLFARFRTPREEVFSLLILRYTRYSPRSAGGGVENRMQLSIDVAGRILLRPPLLDPFHEQLI